MLAEIPSSPRSIMVLFHEIVMTAVHASQALHAFELALSLEKLNYNKLWALDDIASKSEDYELASYVEEILQMQVCTNWRHRPGTVYHVTSVQVRHEDAFRTLVPHYKVCVSTAAVWPAERPQSLNLACLIVSTPLRPCVPAGHPPV